MPVHGVASPFHRFPEYRHRNQISVMIHQVLLGIACVLPGIAHNHSEVPAAAKAIRVYLVDCACTEDLIQSGAPSCLTVIVTPGAAGDCGQRCNDIPGCEGNAVNCCPSAGVASVSINNWATCCPIFGNASVGLNGLPQGTISNGSGSSVGNMPVGGNATTCSGQSDGRESSGDTITVICNGGSYTISIIDICLRCRG